MKTGVVFCLVYYQKVVLRRKDEIHEMNSVYLNYEAMHICIFGAINTMVITHNYKNIHKYLEMSMSQSDVKEYVGDPIKDKVNLEYGNNHHLRSYWFCRVELGLKFNF